MGSVRLWDAPFVSVTVSVLLLALFVTTMVNTSVVVSTPVTCFVIFSVPTFSLLVIVPLMLTELLPSTV